MTGSEPALHDPEHAIERLLAVSQHVCAQRRSEAGACSDTDCVCRKARGFSDARFMAEFGEALQPLLGRHAMKVR